MAEEVIYADRMINISIQAGLVRISLGVLESPVEGKEPEARATHRLVMPIDAFIAAGRLQNQALRAIAEEQKKRQAVPGQGDSQQTPAA